uniref:Uncharacterized protein n=1 Tax=Oryctolagus cuniculus TaxID=9986 RepID=A0A5F9CD40_RABIT
MINIINPTHNNSILIGNSYLPRHKPWLTYSISPCQWSIDVFYLPLYTHRPWNLLWLINISRNLKHRHYSIILRNSNSIHRLCSPMRPNIILRGNSNYQPLISHPLHQNKLS